VSFDPGTACGYSTHALAHASLVCETVTGMPYDQSAIKALFQPLGIERWWFQYYEGIPMDARSKPGSGGQLVAFVPGLDLVHRSRRREPALKGYYIGVCGGKLARTYVRGYGMGWLTSGCRFQGRG